MTASEDFEELTALAKRLDLSDDEAENFVTSGMKRLGHVMKSLWEDAPKDGGKSGSGDFFSQRRESKEEKRAVGGFRQYD